MLLPLAVGPHKRLHKQANFSGYLLTRARFCAALCGRPGDTMNADKSTAIMLYNLVEALEAAGARLQHVYFTQVCCALLPAPHMAFPSNSSLPAQLSELLLGNVCDLCDGWR